MGKQKLEKIKEERDKMRSTLELEKKRSAQEKSKLQEDNYNLKMQARSLPKLEEEIKALKAQNARKKAEVVKPGTCQRCEKHSEIIKEKQAEFKKQQESFQRQHE